jgi:hypothetical protein
MRCFGRRGKFFGARLIGLLVLPSTEVDGGVSATCSGCMVLSLWSTFSPAQPWARQDAPFFQGDGETQCSKVRSNDPSKLARSPFGAGLIGLLLRAWTSTDFLQIRLIWRARSASKGDQQPSPLSLWRARSVSFLRRLLRRTPQTLITSTRFFLNPAQGFADVCNAYNVPEERRFSFDRRGK